MTGKKISESIKNEIIHLYRHTGETTSTLAERYGVSNSTISRMLKITLPEQEYEVLIASKRAARVPGTDAGKQVASNSSEIQPAIAGKQVASNSSEIQPVIVVAPQIEFKSILPLEETNATPIPIIKRRTINSRAENLPVAQEDLTQPSVTSNQTSATAEFSVDRNRNTLISQSADLNSAPPISKVISLPEKPAANNLNFPTDAETSALVAQMLGEDILEEAEDSEGLEDEDLDYLDDDEPTRIVKKHSASNVLVQVLPLSEANLPKTCYLVIDRLSELITRPLKEFGDLGQIPAQETNQKTLPVFDNHRVARRFSTKRDRVIKVPDSKMLQKACPHLQAKGITRLLVDGQVYSLYPS